MNITNINNSNAAYTILSQNYLGQALALKESFLKFHPDVDFYIILIDRRTSESEQAIAGINVIWAEDLPIDNYWRHAFKFDVIEWSTNVKPFAAKLLLSNYEKLLYLDPDLYFYKNIDWIFSALTTNAVVVTPHATAPIYDNHPQGDLEWMRVGTFNLGFIGMKRCAETESFLTWWGQRCLSDGYMDTARGVFVDQKWLTLAVAFYPGIKILFDKGINVATWNFHERRLISGLPEPVFEDGSSLYFFHFSGFDFDNPKGFSKRQSRWGAGSRPDFEKLAENYKVALEVNNFKEKINLPYGNDFFSNKIYITPLARRVYSLLFERFESVDPFLEGSDVYQYLLKAKLIGPKINPEKRLYAKDVPNFGRQIRAIDFILRLTLKIIGPSRYFNLMRYVAHVSSIREQVGVFRR